MNRIDFYCLQEIRQESAAAEHEESQRSIYG